MKKTSTASLYVGILILTLMSWPNLGTAGVDIDIGVNLGLPPPVVIEAPPPVVIEAPPPVVVIPGTYVYFVPGLQVDIFFYHGYWYRRHEGRWFRAHDYTGPWGHIKRARVPRVMHHLPADYRHVSRAHHRIPHRELKTHWRTWEREKHWDRHESRHHRDRDRHESRHHWDRDRHESRGDGDGNHREEGREENQGHGKGNKRHQDN